MSARAFEAFLTRIYVDAGARARFKANPRAEAQRAGLSREECTALENTDWVGLEMAARSFTHKRQATVKGNHAYSFRDRLHRAFTNLAKRVRSIL
jgi:hypothetical protein